MINDSPIRDRVVENGDEESLRVAIYARTSSQSQEYGYSLDAQVNRSVDRCESLGWEVVFVYRDEAESGKDPDRPMFQAMLETAEKDAFDVIVFWKLDRFSRSLMHAVSLEAELRENNVSLYSVTEQIDTTSATGRFNFRNIASAAEFERDMIQQRTKMGLNELAAEYKWPNDSPPLGYQLDSNGRLSIKEDEEAVVKQIFEMYIDRRSMPQVATELNEQGIRTKENGEWDARAVSEILRNEIYIGQYEVANVSDFVAEYQVIEKEVFEEVRTIRNRFQSDENSQPSMADPRKEEIVSRIYQMYCDYLD